MDISLSHALRVPEVVVFRGTAASCSEQALVLDAKGVAYRFEATDADVLLVVNSDDASTAAEELARYAAERIERREQLRVFLPFKGGAAGALIYVSVLIGVAFLAGKQEFGADWFGLGALNSDANSAGEWWRSITALTLHLDQEHLLGNLLFGSGIGILAARMFGPGVAWLSILLCAAAANYADMLMSPSTHRAIGASTAVFAGLGILAGFGGGRRAAFFERMRSAYRRGSLFGGVFLLAFLGAGGEHVDVLGHILGFAAGVVAGVGFTRTGMPSRGKLLQPATGLMALGLVLSAWLAAFRAAG